MSTVVTFNGLSYIVPATGDVGWGNNVSSYLIAIAAGAFQKTAGSFALSAEADFGNSFGLKSLYYKSETANPSSTGILRLANNSDSISFRNAANSADLPLLVDSSNQLTFNGVPVGSPTGAATTALNNLAAVAINTSLLPGVDNTIDLGSSTFAWHNGFVQNLTLGKVSRQGSLVIYPSSPGTNKVTVQYEGAASGTDQIVLIPNLVADSKIVAAVNYGTTGQVLTSTGSSSLPTFQTLPSSGANTSLSNLASTAVNVNILPGVTDSITLGSASFEWDHVFSRIFTVPAAGSYIFETTTNFTGGNTGIETFIGGIKVLTTTTLGLQTEPGKYIQINAAPSGDLARLQFDNNFTSIWRGSTDFNLHFNLNNGITGVEWLTVDYPTSTAKFVAKLSIPNNSVAPSSPITGQIYWDSVTTQFYGWNGTAWKPFTQTANAGMTTGTYAGNSTGGRNIAHGLGVTPTYIMIIETDSVNGVAPAVWSSDFPNQSGGARDTSGTYSTDYITGADATNFTLGTSAVVNGNTRFYQWMAWAAQ